MQSIRASTNLCKKEDIEKDGSNRNNGNSRAREACRVGISLEKKIVSN